MVTASLSTNESAALVSCTPEGALRMALKQRGARIPARERGDRIRYVRRSVLQIRDQAGFAKLLGITRGAVGNWELGHGIKTENLRLIASKTGVSLDWLESGRGPRPGPWAGASDLAEGLTDVGDPQPVPVEGSFDPDYGARPYDGGIPPGMVRVREVELYAGAGGGGEIPTQYTRNADGSWSQTDKVLASVTFPAVWLAQMGLDPYWTDLVRVRGDSMFPEIDDGDWVFVDRRIHRLEVDDIYLIWDGWGIVVKSLRIVRSSRNSPRVMVISANPKYPPEEMPADDIQIIGRVHFRIGRVLRAS
jgi:phage repressor protein C with HTH and peptisase S24 domain